MEDYGNMFTVMPMNQRFLLTPGETYEGTITVVNPADAKTDFHYRASVTPYSVLGTDYAADLATRTNASAIVDWITIENPTETLAPNSFEEIKFTIKVPENAAGGGQYATITVGSDEEIKSDNSVAIGNIFEMASIIYGEVEGEINHSGEIKENTVPGFSAAPPVEVSALLTNGGNIHEDALIVVKATNMFTGETYLPTEDNAGEYNEIVMPGTERYTTHEVENLPFLGMVHVEQTVYYLGVSSTQAVNVLICPIWFLILVIAALGGIIATIVRLILGRRRKKAEVV